MKYDVVTIGDASEDIFIQPKGLKVEKGQRALSGQSVIIELGTKIPVPDAQLEIGGSACNTAVGFSRMGLDTATIVCLGKEDNMSINIENRLSDEGVATGLIVKKNDVEANFSVILMAGDERTIFVHRNLDDYSPLKPKKTLSTDWIYTGPMGQKSDDVFKNILHLTSEKNVRFAWNPGSRQIQKAARSYRSLLKNTAIIFLNREEAIRFINIPVKSNPKDLAESLSRMGVELVVITDGKKGANCFDGRRHFHIDDATKERVDPTGAGDSFAAGFTARTIKAEEVNQDVVEEALKWGVFNSTSVVNTIGTQPGLLSESEIEDEMAKNPRLSVEIL